MVKLNFHQSLFQSSVSHDSSEIILICWFAAQETGLSIVSVENSFAHFFNIFVETMINVFQDSLMKRQFKRTALIQNRNILQFAYHCKGLKFNLWLIESILAE